MERKALWWSESGAKPPRHVRVADDRMTADAAYKLACEGTALLWRGDFHGARQLLAALRRRVDRKPRPGTAAASPARGLPSAPAGRSPTARVCSACCSYRSTGAAGRLRPCRCAARPTCARRASEAYGPAPRRAPARRAARTARRGRRARVAAAGACDVPALAGDRIHPAYGVFSPVRGEYVDLVARRALCPLETAGVRHRHRHGVLSAVLARRGSRARRRHRPGSARAGVRPREPRPAGRCRRR